MSNEKSESQLFKRLLHWTHSWDSDGLIRDRPIQLLLTVALTTAAFVSADAATGWHVWDRLFYPAQKTPADVQAWSALIYAIALVLGLPVAFLLWHWRDRNVRDQIDNARKDINLKEFQEVQLRAAGGLDDKLSQVAREQLQIAALHQLRGFLRGEQGDSFRRPAAELLLAGHATAMQSMGLKEAYEDCLTEENTNASDKLASRIAIVFNEVKNSWSLVDIVRMRILGEDYLHIFDIADISLSNRRMDGIFFETSQNVHFAKNGDLHHKLSGTILSGANLQWTKLDHTDLSNTHLEGANLYGVSAKWAILEFSHLDGAHLENSDFSNADFSEASLRGTVLTWSRLSSTHMVETNLEQANLRLSQLDDSVLFAANLRNADLSEANLKGADLRSACLDGSNMYKSNITGADISGASLEDVRMRGAIFDDSTKLCDNWNELSLEEKSDEQNILRSLGAIHIDSVVS